MFVVALESYLATIPGASEPPTVRTIWLHSIQNKGWRFHEGASFLPLLMMETDRREIA